MKDLLAGLGFLILIAVAFGGLAYKFNDCKSVGHSTLYCIMDVS